MRREIITIALWIINCAIYGLLGYGYAKDHPDNKKLMQMYDYGYNKGYYNATKKKGVITEGKDSYSYTVSHSDYDTVRILDSLRVSKILSE